MSRVTGTLRVESDPGEHHSRTMHVAVAEARRYPLIEVTAVHNDTEVRVFADDTVYTATGRWQAQREAQQAHRPGFAVLDSDEIREAQQRPAYNLSRGEWSDGWGQS